MYINPNTYRYRVMHGRRCDAQVYQCGPAPQPTDITAEWLATLGSPEPHEQASAGWTPDGELSGVHPADRKETPPLEHP
jgi:hypothetical protein